MLSDKKIVLITGASSGFGALTARYLADAGLRVYASMRNISGKNKEKAIETESYAQSKKLELFPIEMDISSDSSVQSAVDTIIRKEGQVDVVIHNAGHMTFGPAEAFLPEQYHQIYDTNVIGTQRVNRAVLPHLRKKRRGLLVWISSSSTRGGTPPYLGLYFAAKAAMDSLAVTYASELIRWGIETSIVVPGAFPTGTNHFINAGKPKDQSRYQQYSTGPYKGLEEQIHKGFEKIVPPETDISTVAKAITNIVLTPEGSRPFRVHIDPVGDGAEEVSMVADQMRLDFLKRIGLNDLLVLPTQDID